MQHGVLKNLTHQDSWKVDFEQQVERYNEIWYPCVMDMAQHMFEIQEWQQEADVYMVIHHRKHSELSLQISVVKDQVSRIATHLGVPMPNAQEHMTLQRMVTLQSLQSYRVLFAPTR